MVNERFLQIEDVNVNLDTELHSLVRLKEELKMEPVRDIRDTKELTEEIVLLESAVKHDSRRERETFKRNRRPRQRDRRRFSSNYKQLHV